MVLTIEYNLGIDNLLVLLWWWWLCGLQWDLSLCYSFLSGTGDDWDFVDVFDISDWWYRLNMS